MVRINVKKILIVLCTILHLGNSKKHCGSNACHPTDDDLINVHVIAHTHDDVGWTATVEEYYKGYSPAPASVKRIISTSLEALRDNPDRRFMYVESAFLFKWWDEQTPHTKNHFKQLVTNGQLELVSGAWSMNDEATTNYQSIIDQFTLGLRKINETFGECGRPRIGWQIDPFGHSSEMASIFAHLGFDGLFLGRIDYTDKEHKFRTKKAEMIWQGSKSLERRSRIFTTILFNTYWPPEGFCVDWLCSYSQVDNLDKYWPVLVDFLKNQAKVYRTNNIMLTMGGDFHFSRAGYNFEKLEKLIKYGNNKKADGSKFNFIYSTPSCYLKAVKRSAKKAKITWQLMEGDFLPYASNPNRYWTGFYTSRPTLKRFERIGNNFLQVCKQLSFLANVTNLKKIETLKEAMGVMQHHDAITGTERQHVARDYSRMLYKGLYNCSNVTAVSLNKLLMSNPEDEYSYPNIPFKSCFLANISQCYLTEASDRFVVTVYNPLSRIVNHTVRIPVTDAYYLVQDQNGQLPFIQMVPIPKHVLNIPGRNSNATMELVFLAKNLPPLGFLSYYVIRRSKFKAKSVKVSRDQRKVIVKLDEETGFLNEIIVNDETIPISQEFFYYEGVSRQSDNDGAYIFRPTSQSATKISNSAHIKIYEGPILTEIHQTFNDWLSQVIKVYHTESYVELQWVVGPLPDYHYKSKQVISRFTTNLNTKSIFYTDSNGREMIKRVRNSRPTFKLNVTQPISGNYYPVTSKILIRDEKKWLEMAVLTDRAQGGSSLEDGEIELMLHRNCASDDGLGVDEVLREEAFHRPLVVRGTHYLIAGTTKKSGNASLAQMEKDLAQRKLLEAWTFFSPMNDLSYSDYKALFKMKYSGLIRALPKNLQIITLELLNKNQFLLRLEHVYEKGEDSVLSKTEKLDLKKVFRGIRIVNAKETTLGANEWLSDRKKRKMGETQFEAKIKKNDKTAKLLHTRKTEHSKKTKKSGKRQRRTKISEHLRIRRADESEDLQEKEGLDGEGLGGEALAEEGRWIYMYPHQIRTFILTFKRLST